MFSYSHIGDVYKLTTKTSLGAEVSPQTQFWEWMAYGKCKDRERCPGKISHTWPGGCLYICCFSGIKTYKLVVTCTSCFRRPFSQKQAYMQLALIKNNQTLPFGTSAEFFFCGLNSNSFCGIEHKNTVFQFVSVSSMQITLHLSCR